jgi:hypothetical protein
MHLNRKNPGLPSYRLQGHGQQDVERLRQDGLHAHLQDGLGILPEVRRDDDHRNLPGEARVIEALEEVPAVRPASSGQKDDVRQRRIRALLRLRVSE